jgi:hypothetical protein
VNEVELKDNAKCKVESRYENSRAINIAEQYLVLAVNFA